MEQIIANLLVADNAVIQKVWKTLVLLDFHFGFCIERIFKCNLRHQFDVFDYA